jgi:hypothetical protein
VICLIVAASPARAAHGQAAAASASPAAAATQQQDDEAALQLAEPSYRVINLPTTLRLPLYRGDFELTHRFAGNLTRGSFGDQASNLFGLDEGAVIGLEFRFAVARHLQAAVFRTNLDKTFQFYGKYDALHQNASMPVSVSGLVSVEGADNFKRDRAPSLGATVSHTFGDYVAVYGVPVWVHNSAALTGVTRDTFFVGLGSRVRILDTVYLVGEVSPRVSGYAPGNPEFGFGIEKRVGGHMFQLNFTNTFGTTFGQIARGGFPDTLYLGFNLARKFF